MLALIADLVVLFAAVHTYAARDGKTCSSAALAFCVVFATISGVNTFLLLVIAPHAANEPALALLFSFHWPSMNLALDLFAWGPVLGLALLFAAPVFHGDRLQLMTRVALILAGILCEGNILCFVVGEPHFSILGILGYDLVLPVVCVCLAILFWRSEASVA
jgi:hypothetical protein